MHPTITITISLGSTLNLVALHQVIDWSTRLNSAEPDAFEDIKREAPQAAPVDVGTSGPDVQPEPAEETATAAVTGSPVLPPGIDGPPAKRKGGRPKSARTLEREAAEAAEAAQTAQTAPPAPPAQSVMPDGPQPAVQNVHPIAGSAVPPGFTVPAMPQPSVSPAAPAMTKEDLRALFSQVHAEDPQRTLELMTATTWSDGTVKPVMNSIENIPPQQYDRLFAELDTLLSRHYLRQLHAKAYAHRMDETNRIMRATHWSDGTVKPQRWFTVDQVQPAQFERLYRELETVLPQPLRA